MKYSLVQRFQLIKKKKTIIKKDHTRQRFKVHLPMCSVISDDWTFYQDLVGVQRPCLIDASLTRLVATGVKQLSLASSVIVFLRKLHCLLLLSNLL